jgi:Tol biopolymer transport system component
MEEGSKRVEGYGLGETQYVVSPKPGEIPMEKKALASLLVITLALCLTTCAPQPQSSLFVVEGVKLVEIDSQIGKADQLVAKGYDFGISSNGEKIAYSTWDSSTTTNIWVLEESNVQKIAQVPYSTESILGPFTWSSDDSHIAFLSGEISSYGQELVVLDMNTGKWQHVASSVPRYAWRPRSQQIAAFLAQGDDQGGLYLLDLIQQTRQRLMKSYIEDMAWSPDGKQIAVVANEYSQIPLIRKLVIIDIASSTQKVIYSEAVNVSGLSWSPDGKYIMLRTEFRNLLIVDSKGKNTQIVSKQAYHYGATWSPDSKSIAYFKEDQGSRDPFLMVVFELESGSEKVLVSQASPASDLLAWR